MTTLEVRCRCVWHGVPCQKEATQEDGLCDWCGTRRSEDMVDNPFWDPLNGLAGGTVTGYNHQAGWGPIPDSVRPTACWMEEVKAPRLLIPDTIIRRSDGPVGDR